MIFEVGVILLALLWALSLWFFLNYTKRQRELAAQQAIGDALHELRAVVAPLPEKLAQLEQRDPGSLSFAQAAKLVGMGASVDELTQACGLTQAEAELMSKLHRG